jgi:hypothetical protein
MRLTGHDLAIISVALTNYAADARHRLKQKGATIEDGKPTPTTAGRDADRADTLCEMFEGATAVEIEGVDDDEPEEAESSERIDDGERSHIAAEAQKLK